MKQRLIDANALKRYIDDCDVCTNCKEKKLLCDIDCPMPDCLTKDWERVIDEQPTVDAVPVVRCRECIHRDPEDHRCDCGGHEWLKGRVLPMPDDFYCADGERRTDEQG